MKQEPDAMPLERAGLEDIPEIVALMNAAYRGNSSGWHTEAGYIAGERTNVAMLEAEMRGKPDASQLVSRDGGNGRITACVWLEPLPADVWYLGALTVDPTRQNRGAGSQLLASAEQWATEQGARTIRMTVINVRDALIAWYERRGYALTGEVQPFPYGDDRFGIPLRDDLHFMVMEKRLAA